MLRMIQKNNVTEQQTILKSIGSFISMLLVSLTLFTLQQFPWLKI